MEIRLDYDRVAMLNRFRQFWTKVIAPIATLLLRLGVSPDAVTLVGTFGVAAGALVFFPRGELWIGTLVITLFVFSDLIDGHMARTSGTSSKWGSYLDSTLDRLGDGAVFGGLVLFYANSDAGDSTVMTAVTLWALVMGATTSYARAKAESLGLQASGGLAERSDRLVLVLVVGFFSDVLNVPILLQIVLWYLAVASTITVVQRSLSVRKQVLADPANAGLGTPPAAGGAPAGNAATQPGNGSPRGAAPQPDSGSGPGAATQADSGSASGTATHGNGGSLPGPATQADGGSARGSATGGTDFGGDRRGGERGDGPDGPGSSPSV
ncbi:phosphatidylinositol phosphate synthase [Kribbella sp. CA-253562]|uniref:phosphatidylinositol phosphate synthase n=1 Tax=Kribbella sp. CA-253562 TaxID=3239942 RepID=UPI003D8AA7E8